MLTLKGGTVVDPFTGFEGAADVVIEGERIVAVQPRSEEAAGAPAAGVSSVGNGEAAVDYSEQQTGGDLPAVGAEERGGKPNLQARVLDVSGLIVAPGLIDLHVHLREPGFTHRETIASGTRAAARGGFTTIACMPNTRPVVDCAALVESVKARAQATGVVRVLPIGAITKGQAGEEMALLGEMAVAGAVAFSDDGRGVMNAALMRRAMVYAGMFDRPLISHCEDSNLAGAGVMHAGYWSTVLGLPGIPALAEEVMVGRDLQLAASTGTRLHLAHVSTAGSVALLRAAKAQGVRVTAEVTPHHLILTDAAVQGYNPNTKVNPPLRSETDVQALREALADGTIDAIATDHAPYSQEEKDGDFLSAPFGLVGLETALGLVLTYLVTPGILSLKDALARFTVGPARVLGLPQEGIVPGAVADLVVIDPAAMWVVQPDEFASQGRNTPFAGWELRGRAVKTIVGGKIVWEEPRPSRS